VITVVLADDHAIVRQGLRRLLEDCRDIEIIGEANNGHEALRVIRQAAPDVVVMDLSMPGLDGIETTKQIASEGLKTKIVILTMHATEEYAARLLQAGAQGFVGKEAFGDEVVEAIRQVAAGECYLPSALSRELPKRYARHQGDTSPLQTLSDRELQVLKRLAEGCGIRAIAEELHLSVKTIETYRTRLGAKLDLKTTADLVRFALRCGVIADTW
jgi:two-component system, NarL family, invasion response regulator UvrY